MICESFPAGSPHGKSLSEVQTVLADNAMYGSKTVLVVAIEHRNIRNRYQCFREELH